MSAENWHEERDRLVELLQAIESGKVTHIDEDNLRQLQPTNPENIALLRERLAKLNARLGDKRALGASFDKAGAPASLSRRAPQQSDATAAYRRSHQSHPPGAARVRTNQPEPLAS